MTLTVFIEQLINGLIMGSMYSLLGSGLTLIYGTMRILNFAHGEMYMLGGYLMFFFFKQYGILPVPSILFAVAAVFLIAMVFQRLSLHYLVKKENSAFSTIAMTLGFSIVLQNIALRLWGARFNHIPYYIEGSLQIGELRIPMMRILILVVAVATIVIMTVLLKYTRFGMAVRATSQDRDAAEVLGVPAHRIHMLTFAIGSALSALAGTMLAPIYAINPWMGVPVMLKGFVVIILGGLGSYPGAILGGIILGIIEAVGLTLTSSAWRDVISFIVLILIIWVKPWGLFGVKEK